MKLKNVLNDIDILHTKCEDVKEINKEILSTLDEMLECMYKNRGIGLTANQVGILKKLIVIDLQENDVKLPLYLINPEILEKSDECEMGEEGCLSVPTVRVNMKRSKNIKVKYLDREGKENIIDADGLLAICIQHEMDHMNGITIYDSLSKIKKDFALKKIKKFLIEKGKK